MWQAYVVKRHTWCGRSEARVEIQGYSRVGRFGLGIGWGTSKCADRGNIVQLQLERGRWRLLKNAYVG
eukprot:scaffold2630_cov72-Attheya_sp.AAC.5